MLEDGAVRVGIRTLLLGAVSAMLLLAMLLWRAEQAGARALAASDSAFDQGDLPGSMREARSAIRWYFPFAPHVAEAEARLIAIAEGAESSGDPALALAAWSALRSSLRETEHGWTVGSDLQSRSNDAIARLLPRIGPGSTVEAAALQTVYVKSERVDSVFQLARSLGLSLSIAGGVLLLIRTRWQWLGAGFMCLALGLFAWIFAAVGA